MRRGARIVVAGGVLAALLAASGALWVADRYQRPGPLAYATTIIVPKGAGVPEIAQLLDAATVISEPPIFRIAARLEGLDASLRAGEYRFPPAVSMQRVLAMLRQGDTVVRRVTIPEGMTSRQVVSLLGEAEGLEGEIAAAPVEGALLPETYGYSWGDSRSEMIRRMSVGDVGDARRTVGEPRRGAAARLAARGGHPRLDRREGDRRAAGAAASGRGLPQPPAAGHEAAGRSHRHLRRLRRESRRLGR